MRWAREFALGARAALAGGRESAVRLVLTAVGVGLGVVVLLGAASLPQALHAAADRDGARKAPEGQPPPRGSDTLLVGVADTTFRGDTIRGRLLQPEGRDAPLPPGVARMPRPGELVVSPALADRLDEADAALLRARLRGRIVGTIASTGLTGPTELAYYAGSATLRAGDLVTRLDRFGGPPPQALEPLLYVLVVIMVVVLLAPIGVFIASAVRFGGEARDRRLAAVRLLGADRGMALRIAAGESLVGALAGLLVGAVLFVGVRPLVERVSLWDVGMFAADLRPSAALAALVGLLVPAAAVLVTLLSLRRVVIEPLGVVRRAPGRRRRVLWRLALPLAGLAVLAPLIDRGDGGSVDGYQLAAGMVLVLAGVTALLPWLVERVVARLGGGAVPWQLATRRLQLESGSAVRAVSGITVAVAGAIGLQMAFHGVEKTNRIELSQHADGVRAYAGMPASSGPAAHERVTAALRGAPGVDVVLPFEESDLERNGRFAGVLIVGSCDALRYYAELGPCRDGDAFVLRDEEGAVEAPAVPGRAVEVDGARWRVPPSAREVSIADEAIGWARGGVLATPGAIPASLERRPARYTFFSLDGTDEAIEHARNAVAGADPLAGVASLDGYLEDASFDLVRRALYAAAAIVLLLIGASFLVSLLEQLRDRRRLLAALVAAGARRATLGWSVLIQTAIPVALGVGLAIVAGVGLGAVLLAIVSEPVRIDVAAIGVMAGAGAGVVVAVTVLTLPALGRLMRPDGLRAE